MHSYLNKNKESENSKTLFTLVLTRGITILPRLILSLLMVELCVEFGYSVGVIAQIETTSTAIATISCIFIGVLDITFSPKTMILLGLLLINVLALGCSFSNNFLIIVILYGLGGPGISLVRPIIDALIGDLYAHNNRAG